MSPAFRIAAIAFAFVALMISAHLNGYRLNASPSYPIGVYKLHPITGEIELGRLAFVCSPDTELFRTAHDRDYIGAGLCPGGYAALVKKIAAGPGARVIVGTEVRIDGVTQPVSTVYAKDAQGRPLHYILAA